MELELVITLFMCGECVCHRGGLEGKKAFCEQQKLLGKILIKADRTRGCSPKTSEGNSSRIHLGSCRNYKMSVSSTMGSSGPGVCQIIL